MERRLLILIDTRDGGVPFVRQAEMEILTHEATRRENDRRVDAGRGRLLSWLL
jgi:hypothetical protein